MDLKNQPVSRLASHTLFCLALLGVAVAGSGCYAEASSGVVTTAYVPAHVEVYPQEYYDGHTVYLINDHWYYNDGAHWVYYRQEPDVLVQRRVVYHQAPVVRERTVVHQAPPAHPEYRYEADPARRHAERHEPRAE